MLYLFKGQLSYEDIMYKMTFKEMLTLRDARIESLKEEAEAMKKDQEARQLEQVRNEILNV